ncbi:MLO-like protein 6 [Ranunculus cassubicifolius]
MLWIMVMNSFCVVLISDLFVSRKHLLSSKLRYLFPTFVLAVTHILYAILTMSLARAKMRAWKAWEIETRTMEYQFSHDPERFRFARNTTFGRRHLSFWSRSTILLWIVCFFRQFFRSVLKIDYLTLRHGFIMAHLAPQSATRFDFQKYIKRSVEDDYKVIVGISPIIWFFAIVFLMSNTHGWFAFLWLPFIPLIIILVIGTKLQVIITKMGLRIQDKGEVVRGVPIVQPNDELFWFGRPRLILSLIHFILFQNAFQLAFFAWTTYEFGLKSCYHEHPADIGIRVSMGKNIPNLLALPTNGIVIHVLCSYVTLPLYALVTQMGSTMKPTIFNERVAVALKKWHHTTKKHTKQGGESASVFPMFSMPSTPTHGNNGTSPVHLLYKHRVSVIASLFLNCNINGILFEEEPDSVIASLFLNCNINGI